MKRILPLLFLLVILGNSTTAADSNQAAKQYLIEHTEEKTNIFALSSFQMKATVRIDNNDKPLDGSYLLFWNGPEQWREEITFPGYSEVQVGGKDIVFLKRSTDFVPLRIDQLRSTLGYGTGMIRLGSFIHVAPMPDETVKKIHDQTINGAKAVCAEVAGRENRTRELCVDKSTGGLIRENSFRDRDMMPIGTKLFPRFLSYGEKGKVLVEVQITELKTTEQPPSSAFQPPPEAVSKPGCMNPIPGRLLRKVMPRYPESERQSRVQGRVAIHALIGKDGVPGQFRIVSSVTPALDKASLEAVQQWRYEPATCNGIPVDIETLLTVIFQLQ
jgi:TonB family protein